MPHSRGKPGGDTVPLSFCVRSVDPRLQGHWDRETTVTAEQDDVSGSRAGKAKGL